MNIFSLLEQRIGTALEALKADGKLPADLALPRVEVESPRDPTHGDVASNIAMVLSKAAKMKPRDIAEALAAKLKADAEIAKVDVAGPGFLNISVTPAVWQRIVRAIQKDGDAFGKTDIGKGVKINVEYVSANPTGPMHVGHCRGAVFGDALANLLAFVGYDVTREYYTNDAGGQISVLAKSVFHRYREALGDDVGPVGEGLYPGEYLKPVGASLAKQHGRALTHMPEERWLPIARVHAIAEIMPMIKADLAALNIKHEVFFSEASLTAGSTDKVKVAIDALRAKGFVYEGRLEKPKDHDDGEWEDREQTLFKSTAFGDDADRALQKSDGSYTYFAGDIAYHFDKLSRGYQHLINVWGADHIGYIHRLLAAVAAMSGGNVPLDGKKKLKDWRTAGGASDLDIRVVQLVKLLKNGEPFKMSKRAGTFVTLRDVVDEVGPDPVRFMMLYRKELEPLDFDLARVLEQSKENPVFYVQMAHARAKSVFRNVKDVFADLGETSAAVAGADLARLSDPSELEMIKKLAFYPVMIAGAAKAREPHKVAFYLYELASSFHGHWARGNELPHLRYIQQDDKALTAARLALVAAHAQVLASGLAILGVGAPEELR